MKTLNYGKYNKVNFYPGAPPNWIRHMFNIGNILCLYPSQNLIEISMLPARIKVAIEEFVRVTKPTNIYTRFFAAVPEWDEYLIPVKNVIKSRLTRKLFDPNSQNTHDVTLDKILKIKAFRRSKGFKDQFDFLDTMIKEESIWIYPCEDNIIFSNCTRKTRDQDWALLDHWSDKIMKNENDGSPQFLQEMCKIIVSYIEHSCPNCIIEDMDHVSLNEDDMPADYFEGKMIG
ncbi:Uncharacterized protein Adt_12029 [Abeliophyllum distichum]|uniref:Uncharacterized protein n=1 Tax=Abeliophyllum distichum TaxID=126358 RepID=A0ABD1UPN7_9LAMI